MNGRLEKELKSESKMKKKLSGLPDIFTEFYYWLAGEDKSYTTLSNYISHNVDFMNYVTDEEQNDEFYLNVRPSDVNRYMASLRRKEVNGPKSGTPDIKDFVPSIGSITH